VGILLRPRAEWAIIDTETTSTGALLGYAAVLAGGAALSSSLGLAIIGANIVLALITAVFTCVVTLGSVMLFALLVNAVAGGFGGVGNYNQALKLAIYANTASWVAGLLGFVPVVSLVVVLGGLIYQIVLFSLGMSRVMHTPPEKTVGAVAVAIGGYIGVALVFGFLAALFTTLAHVG
jgi:hypothetical protein